MFLAKENSMLSFGIRIWMSKKLEQIIYDTFEKYIIFNEIDNEKLSLKLKKIHDRELNA